jgi:type II secretory pathway component PulM
MTTEERLEKLELELANANRRNRRLMIGAAVCLAVVIAWALITSKADQAAAYAAIPTTASTSTSSSK